MKKIQQIINQIAAEENQLLKTQFLAPCVLGGQLRTKVAGMMYTFTPKPRNFEGWGIFQPASPKQAKLIEQASLPEIGEYLEKFTPIRLFLAHVLREQTNNVLREQTNNVLPQQTNNVLREQTWLAYPVNESDMQQRTGILKPVPVYLVSDGAAFETIIARWDGKNFWYEDTDRRAEIEPVEHLKNALKNVISPKQIRFKGMTPEMRIVYELVAQKTPEFQAEFQQERDEKRLKEALKMGGGTLQEFRERPDYWLVEWTTGTGERHSSAISKTDLTVISAGICLSGEDRKFDLQSLVGIVEYAD
ncbi:hypothetical protein NG798_01215 [Ancylothrix sp. C2]|uniref:hypothetical protein n=1 Tax=Ancylothrix sp. D3o TaxID=2953691 RepID=UPI0021BA5115|nr:hypothetical protein [Ancylothrix sp. D3o]MCT7948400.1 hypothetical protein [Ancylothrix sp. D3o]